MPNLPVITQINAYDAWGQMLQGVDYERNTNNKSNNFKYNGKENQDDFGIGYTDYGARMYDKILGRWFAQDPLSELDFDQGSYNYVDNNPVRRIDLFGCTDCDNDGKDDGDCKNGGDLPEATIKGERLPQFRGFFENQQIAYTRNERLYGHASPFRKDFQDGGALASGIILAPVAAIGAAEIGVGAFISQGASYLTRARMASAGRWVLQNTFSNSFGIKTLLAKGGINILGQMGTNYLNGELKFDFIGFGSDLLLTNGAAAITGGIGEYTIDLSSGKRDGKINSIGVGFSKFATGFGFGFAGEKTTKFIGPNGFSTLAESVYKLYNEAFDSTIDKLGEQNEKMNNQK